MASAPHRVGQAKAWFRRAKPPMPEPLPARHLRRPWWTIETLRWLVPLLTLTFLLATDAAADHWRAWRPWSSWVSLGLIQGALLGLLLWARERKDDLDSLWEKAHELRHDGRYEEAIAALDRCATHRRVPRSHAKSLMQLGQCHLWLGRFEEAARYFAALEGHPGASLCGLRASAAGHLALCYALAGQPEAALAWVEESQSVLRGGLDEHLGLVARAVVWAKEGKLEEARDRLLGSWFDFDTLTARSARVMRVLLAFTLEGLGEKDRADELLLAIVDFAHVGEFDFFGVGWPAMRAFLGERDLLDPRWSSPRTHLALVH
jgi:tetratricopeptide (TPR) repeat protein